MLNRLKKRLDNQNVRDEFVASQLERLPANTIILDAGCGPQRYRMLCRHLQYRSQDFGQYVRDEKEMLGGGAGGCGGDSGYKYGQLDYVGDVCHIDEKDETFDAVLCTEVLEHIPYPIDAIREFVRLLKVGGKLILTAPSNCLRHMDPYFFYSGFSDRWFQRVLPEHGLSLDTLNPVGDYYSWMCVEIARTASAHSIFSKGLLFPAFIYYYLKRPTSVSVDTLCMGYHLVATRISCSSGESRSGSV